MTREELIMENFEKRNQAHLGFAGRLITLSSGALTLSIAFRHDISAATPIHLWLLRTAWIAFTVTIVAALLVEAGPIALHTNMVNALLQNPNSSAVRAAPGCWFQPASFGMVFSFGIATVCLATFALFNLK